MRRRKDRAMRDFSKHENYLHRQFMHEELQKSKIKMSDPNAIRHDADDVHNELEQILEAYGHSTTRE